MLLPACFRWQRWRRSSSSPMTDQTWQVRPLMPACLLQHSAKALQVVTSSCCPLGVTGLIMAGSADFKTELSQSDLFDPRLQAVVLGVVDVSYGARRLMTPGGRGRQWAVSMAEGAACRACRGGQRLQPGH
jgi:hypothetical protein